MTDRAAAGRRVGVALALALAAMCIAGWWFKAHCLVGGHWPRSVQYTTGCYSDVVPFWHLRGVANGEWPYLQARLEYPVLTGAQIWLQGWATRLLWGARADAAAFLAVASAANALLAGLLLWLLQRAGVDRTRLWLWAAAPPLLLYLGHNWDLGAVAFALGALLAAGRGRLVLASALAALGVAAKLFPVLLLPLLVLSALALPAAGARTRLALAATCALAAVGAWSLVNLPVAVLAPENWSEFYRFSQQRAGTAASVWEILSTQGWWRTTIAQRNAWASALFVAGAAAIVALGWRQHRARPWVLFAPVLAWFMLTNKVYSPQFDLWLYPVLLLTAPRVLPVLLFALAGVAAYFAEFWWFAALDGAWPRATPAAIAVTAALRAAVMLWLIADALRLPPPRWLAARPMPAAA